MDLEQWRHQQSRAGQFIVTPRQQFKIITEVVQQDKNGRITDAELLKILRAAATFMNKYNVRTIRIPGSGEPTDHFPPRHFKKTLTAAFANNKFKITLCYNNKSRGPPN